MFWLAKMSEESFFRTRFIAFRIYSMAVMFVRNRYSSSTDAAVFPSPSSLSDIYDRILNSMASLSRLFVSMSPFTPKQTKSPAPMFVCPLKYLLSAPTHMEWMPRQTVCNVSSV